MANFIRNFIKRQRYRKQVREDYKNAKLGLVTYVSADKNPEEVVGCAKWCFKNTEDGLALKLKIEYCECFGVNPF